MKPDNESIYQIKVTLKDSEPPIWRRIQVPGHITLYKLQRIMQMVMGWENAHLHEFVINGTSYGQSHPEYGLEMKTERRARLDELVPEENMDFIYKYNLDEEWEHHLLVEEIISRTPKVHYPQCVEGDRACPPEDCGGILGYKDLLEIIKNPEDPEYEETIQWLGAFDPTAFDLEEVNQKLKHIRS
jgi:hypothetical protein